MGHSYLEYRGKHRFLHDFEIEVVALSTANFLQKNAGGNNIPKFAKEWIADFPNFANGAIDLRLDYFFPRKEDGRQFLEFIKNTKTAFIAEYSFITEDRFQEWVSGEIVFLDGGISAKKIESCFDKFSTFIENALAE